MTETERWARGSYRTRAHLIDGPRHAACGTFLGHGGSLVNAEGNDYRCRRCQQIAALRRVTK